MASPFTNWLPTRPTDTESVSIFPAFARNIWATLGAATTGGVLGTLNPTGTPMIGWRVVQDTDEISMVAGAYYTGTAWVFDNPPTNKAYRMLYSQAGDYISLQRAPASANPPVFAELMRLASSGASYPVRGSSLNLYVATTGSDSNNGLTSGSPFLTIAHACTVAMTYDAGGLPIIINIAAGTYGSLDLPIFYRQVRGAVGINNGTNQDDYYSDIILAGAGSATTTIAGISAQHGAHIGVRGVTVSGAPALFVVSNGVVNVLDDVILHGSSTTSFVVHAERGGQVYILGTNTGGIPASTTISGNAYSAFHAVLGGRIIVEDSWAVTINITGSPTYSVAFADIEESGSLLYMNASKVTFSGALTSPAQYVVTENAQIVTFGSGPVSFFPGTVSGDKAANGGIVQPWPSGSVTVSGAGVGATASLSGTDSEGYLHFKTGTSGVTTTITLTLTAGAAWNGQQVVPLVSPHSAASWPAGTTVSAQGLSSTSVSVVVATIAALPVSTDFYVWYRIVVD